MTSALEHKSALGTSYVTLAGETYELRPTLRAAQQIEARFGGLRAAIIAVDGWSIDGVAGVLHAVSETTRPLDAVKQQVFEEGVASVARQLIPVLAALMNPRGVTEDPKTPTT